MSNKIYDAREKLAEIFDNKRLSNDEKRRKISEAARGLEPTSRRKRYGKGFGKGKA